jgi:hypothetical protein
MSYNVNVYRRQGGAALVVKSGGSIVVQTGGKILPNSETQAAAIAAVGLTTVAWTTGDKAKVNSIITALSGVGIVATG